MESFKEMANTAPCPFCGYDGSNFYQAGSHKPTCIFYHVGGVEDREKHLLKCFSKFMHDFMTKRMRPEQVLPVCVQITYNWLPMAGQGQEAIVGELGVKSITNVTEDGDSIPCYRIDFEDGSFTIIYNPNQAYYVLPEGVTV